MPFSITDDMSVYSIDDMYEHIAGAELFSNMFARNLKIASLSEFILVHVCVSGSDWGVGGERVGRSFRGLPLIKFKI